MATFIYKAKRGLNEVFEGRIDADNQQEALNKLIAQGLFPVSIFDAAAPKLKTVTNNKFLPFNFNKKVSSREVLVFSQKLSTLLRARVELFSALKIIYEQADNSAFKEVVLALYSSVKEGKALSDSLSGFPEVFSSIFISIVKAGEASGRMDFAFEQISEFLHREENLRAKVSVALAYPALLLLVGVASIFVLITFVVPKLRPLFDSFGTHLPLITRIILNLSLVSSKVWWIVLLHIAGITAIIYFRKGRTHFKPLGLKLISHMPILGRLIRNQELDRFSRSISLLLKSGVPALQALEIATLSLSSVKLKGELKEMCKGVASGSGLAKCMASSTSLPDFFVKMVAIGEESGRISEVLDELARTYTQQIDADIALVTSLIEPVMIIVLGGVLGTIVLSILIPTFQLTQMVR